MRLFAASFVALLIVFSAARPQRPAAPQPGTAPSVAFRAVFGYQRTGSKDYSGSVSATGGAVLGVEPWRFLQGDAVSGESWKLQIRRAVMENQPDRPNPIALGSPAPQNIVPAGVIVRVAATASEAHIRTAQGDFTIPLQQLAFGRMLTYLDGDVLVERVPDADRVSPPGNEQHDYPSLAVTRSGVWTAWQAYEDRGDHVYARPQNGAPMRLTESKADVYRTSIAEDGAGRIHVVWSERRGSDWHLIERIYDGTSWSAARQITSGNSPNIFHKLAPGHSGPLRIVWVAHEGGQSYLYAAAFENGAWSAPQRIGGPSVWSPDAITDAQGNLHVAWDSYQNGNYDIFYRRLPDAAEQVTRSPMFQAHASLTIDQQGRPWLAWDESGANWGKDWNHEDQNRATVLYSDRSIRVAVKDGGEWKQAGDFETAVPERLRRYWELPHLAADGTGRIWALFQIRTSAANNRDDFWCSGGLWDLYLTTFENGVWRPAAFVPNSTARPEVPFQIAAAPDRVWMAWATDGRRFGPQAGFAGATMVHYDVYNAQASAGRPAGAAVFSGPVERPGRAQIMHPNEKQDVQRIRAYRVNAGGTNYRIVRGDFHRHTEISSDGSGDGSVEDYYRYMIDAAEMDTGIIGDHNMGGDVEYSWWRTEKSYDVFHIPGRFTPLFGYERSVPYPNGHRNVVFDHRGVRTLPLGEDERRAAVNSGKIIYPYLRQNRGICMEHSLATGQGTDFRDNDPELEPLVEIYQGYHASYEYKGAPRAEDDVKHLLIHGTYEPLGFWWNALAKGYRLGVQASSDHISTHCSYALIYTPDDSRANIVSNMRQRHAYAATDNIIVDFRGDGHLMGDEYAASGAPKLTAKIIGTDRLMRVDLVRNNEFVYTRTPAGAEFDFEYVDQSPKAGTNYYYVRVMQADGNLAWSSPVWVKK